MGNFSNPLGSPISARAVREGNLIFRNPAGAPELACDECGGRMFDRLTNVCYECGEPISFEAVAEFEAALAAYTANQGTDNEK